MWSERGGASYTSAREKKVPVCVFPRKNFWNGILARSVIKMYLVINMYVYAFSLVCQRLKPQLLERSFQELDANFRSYTRALVGLACNLHRSRELRSLFLELVERCLEPWRQVSWSHTDLRNFLASYFQCALEMDVLRCVIVIVLLSTLTSCGLRCRVYMFHVNFIHKFFIIS
jgi:hypothetical protein